MEISVLTELKNRGLADVLMIVCDGLAGPATGNGRRGPSWSCRPNR
ncbi:MAG TPA: hypothetical protein VIZ20_15805 [Streptosporangiaceae bacterium]